MNIAPGFSSLIIAANMRGMVKAGHTYANAKRWAMNAARKSFFTLHPARELPDRLALPKHGKRAQDYTSQGEPILRGPRDSNPVRELDVDPAELDGIRQAVKKQLSGKGAAVRQAAAAYVAFTGHEDPHVQKLGIPDTPEAVWELGLCDGILYTTIRDGNKETYIHRFKAKARPLLTVSADGNQLFLLGGAYRVTERGIEDFK